MHRLDNRPSKAPVALVEHRALARRYGALRFLGLDSYSVTVFTD